MALSAGSRLGVYEILSVIGEGGMGRVYRARDTRLQRDVAIKVLPDNLAADPERVARFEREARTLAALNHPHIAQIYGTEQSGATRALVMELVEGEDLAQRIARGPIPWREAEPIARQIAEALEAAHEQSIVHRDLKPANIKLTPDGVVKVLDFGLAKAVNATADASPVSATITSPAGVTQAGIILGTAAYMSPEQAKGRPADKRSDVWAFGCVLYEMLTAKRAFPGDDVVDTLAGVVRGEPNLGALPSDVPQELRTLIGRCLIKDRKQRVSDIAVARYALDAGPAVAAPAGPPARNAWPWALATIAGVIAIAAVAMPRLSAPSGEPQSVIRSMLPAPSAATTGSAIVAISRQGTHIAYASTQNRIHVRKLSDGVARPLQGSDGGVNPFFSYDGEWIGFFADNKLKKLSLSGGAARVLADAPSGRGGSWGQDGTIVFSPMPDSGLAKVSDDGGAVTILTKVKPTEGSHRWPHILPDGRTVLFTIQGAGRLSDDAVIAAVPTAGGEPQTVIEGGSGAQYAESGHLIYGRTGTLLAVAFDPVSLRTSGAAITVIDNARTNVLSGAVPFAVSSAGLFVYMAGESAGANMSLRTATRTGQTQPLLERGLFDNFFRLSPDGTRVAVSINDGQIEIWMVDVSNRGINRFTFDSGSKSYPVWSPEGSRLYYATNAGGVQRVVGKAVDRNSPEEAVSKRAMFPTTVSPDGGTLVGRALTSNSYDVVALDLAKATERSAVVASPANESEAAFSPDGRYLAYQSDGSGQTEVWVQAYPSGSKWQVTNTGGMEPRWTAGGREIVYRRGSSVFAVPITQPFAAGPAQTLFSVPNLFAFDVTADGQRFVIALDTANRENVDYVLISGWFEELKAKMRPSR